MFSCKAMGNPERNPRTAIFSCGPDTLAQTFAHGTFNLQFDYTRETNCVNPIYTAVISPLGMPDIVYATYCIIDESLHTSVTSDGVYSRILQTGGNSDGPENYRFTIQLLNNVGNPLPIFYDIFTEIIGNQINGATLRGNSDVDVLGNDNAMDGPGGSQEPVNFCNVQNLPQIFINSLVTSGNNLGDLTYSIYDTVSYSCDPGQTSKKSIDGIVYKSNFGQSFPIQTVLKGTGSTVKEKVTYIIAKFGITYTSSQFLLLISFYAAIRFILSFVLTGKFNIDFLLGKYYDKFLCALKNSKFYKFAKLFGVVVVDLNNIPTSVDFSVFYQYFLYDKPRHICDGSDAIHINCDLAFIYCNKCKNKCHNTCQNRYNNRFY